MAVVATMYSVGDRLQAADLNVDVSAIQELQAEAGRVYFEQTKTITTVANTDSPWGVWTTASTFTSSGNGLTVPSDGVYGIGMAWTTPAGGFNTRSYLGLTLNGVANAWRQCAPASAVDVVASGTCIALLSAGQVIEPRYYQITNGASNSLLLKILRLSI
jgi:hypothetical protein